MMFSGPSFEFPAKLCLREPSALPPSVCYGAGGDYAAHCGIQTIGISLITNMAAGILDQKLTHEEVQETRRLLRKNSQTSGKNRRNRVLNLAQQTLARQFAGVFCWIKTYSIVVQLRRIDNG
jgi:hypothetical protein